MDLTSQILRSNSSHVSLIHLWEIMVLMYLQGCIRIYTRLRVNANLVNANLVKANLANANLVNTNFCLS